MCNLAKRLRGKSINHRNTPLATVVPIKLFKGIIDNSTGIPIPNCAIIRAWIGEPFIKAQLVNF